MNNRVFLAEAIAEAVRSGARRHKAAEAVGISLRTLERWAKDPRDDGRKDNRFTKSNALTRAEQELVIAIACSPEHRDRSPNQIVPILAEQGVYVASERTFYRLLRLFGLLKHRSTARAPERERPGELVATAPNQVWTWDISYLLTTVRGVYLYLYVILDIWDRTMVGWAIHETESGDHASVLLNEACMRHKVRPGEVTIHNDNGAPMISAEFMSTVMAWGQASYSRPGVSDDNPFSEAMFRTIKYRPNYPERFESAEEARAHFEKFDTWYHNEHRHSAINFVTPMQRRTGEHLEILSTRKEAYETARCLHPERWSGNVRDWEPITAVHLNPRHKQKKSRQGKAA